MKEKVKTLWQLCFNDSEAFIDMYFRLRYTQEVNIAIQSGGEILSALQMLPYPMTFCGQTVQTSYISGACTHPDFRGKGVMRELLSQSFARMFQKNIHFSTLIPAEPWLFDYYTRMGYASAFEYSTREITIPEFIPTKEIIVDTASKYKAEVYEYLNRKLSSRPCCIQHTSKDFRVIMTDLAISGGTLFVARRANEISGLAVVYKRGEHFVINELLAETADIEHNLLHHINQQSEKRQVIQLLPPNAAQPKHRLGMARIIHAKEVLQLYASAFPKEKMQLEVTDKQLATNNGYYYVSNGKCMYSTERLPGAHTAMNIGELTERILHPLQPYMSLMLN